MGILRSYLAFHYRRPELLDSFVEYRELYEFAKSEADEIVLKWFKTYG